MYTNIPIIVVGYNRPKAIERLLNSLLKASYSGTVELIISIDGGGDSGVKEIADKFAWPFGKKKLIFQDTNMGLRNHVLSCGDLSRNYDAVIVLEDDLCVSPAFYQYALQAYDYYKDDLKLGGISLYHHAYNETAQFPFIPLADGTDVYFLQYASSWGQMWTRDQWKRFRSWYDERRYDVEPENILPKNIRLWPENSWKKYFIEFLIIESLYIVYPRVSFTTIFGDEGTNIRIRETFLQVPLWYGERPFIFSSFDDSDAVYDTWCEMLPDRLKRLSKKMNEYDFAVDLYGMKSLKMIKKPYLLSGRSCKNPQLTFAREMKPHESNIIHDIPGNEIFFGKKEDFKDRDYFIKLLKVHEKKELAYWYTIREYHFYKNRLLTTNRSSNYLLDPVFFFRKFLVMANYTYKYFGRK